MSEMPLVVIAGPTASGKTAVAIRIAKCWDGEVICADSRTIYKDMNVGTAKPSVAERDGVVHWGIDLVSPGELFTAADFKMYATEKIADIRRRGKVPLLVGGTGLYVDAVLFDYQFGERSNDSQRSALEAQSIDDLINYCIKNNIELPENKRNKRYVIRAIEQKGVNRQSGRTPISNSIIVGIATDRDELRRRIGGRAEQMFNDNVVEEAIMLGKKYGWDNEAMTGNIYPLLRRHLSGELSLADVADKFTTLDWRLAKRQLTWLRRNKHLVWLPVQEVEGYVGERLATEQ